MRNTVLINVTETDLNLKHASGSFGDHFNNIGPVSESCVTSQHYKREIQEGGNDFVHHNYFLCGMLLTARNYNYSTAANKKIIINNPLILGISADVCDRDRFFHLQFSDIVQNPTLRIHNVSYTGHIRHINLLSKALSQQCD